MKYVIVYYSFAFDYKGIEKLPLRIKQADLSVQKKYTKGKWQIENRHNNAIDVWYVSTGNGLNKPILPFKLNQVKRYQWYNREMSIYCFQL